MIDFDPRIILSSCTFTLSHLPPTPPLFCRSLKGTKRTSVTTTNQTKRHEFWARSSQNEPSHLLELKIHIYQIEENETIISLLALSPSPRTHTLSLSLSLYIYIYIFFFCHFSLYDLKLNYFHKRTLFSHYYSIFPAYNIILLLKGKPNNNNQQVVHWHELQSSD